MAPVYFLLVDDLEENLLSLDALLRRDGLVLLKARSGDEALELLLTHDVALALVDVQMPGLNGFELAELMRGNERTRRIPIIFVTAGASDTQRRFQGYGAGAVDFIYKPIEPDILRSKAEVFFELYRQRQQLAEQRDTLRQQAEALRDADRRKDDFLATLAHELRNPLAPLRHGLDLLRRNPGRDQAADIHAMMDRQLTQLVRLIDDLLDVSRISQGKIELRLAPVPLSDVLRLALETSQPLIAAAGHNLTVLQPQTPLWLQADLSRLAQIIGNLLNNAAKYTPAGGHITLDAHQEGEAAVISVIDDGMGIPAEMLESVFQLFTQIDAHRHQAQGGLGIGLALAQQLAALQGGQISVESAGPGQGSRFTIRMQLIEAPPLAAPAPAASAPASGPRRILVVDDTVEVAQTVGWMLDEMGHDYELLHDGHGALDAARRYRPDIILLDIGLPGLNGYEVCRLLRQEAALRGIQIVAQTGWGQERDKERAAEAGFDHHLVKPVSFEALEALIADIAQHDPHWTQSGP
ncbi:MULTISPECIES: response regulator [unclassified Acidocella]|uniref:response regulator n=1 Tax=unclassified Acidocella TaxID=2648610 RepID=UPI00028DB799|nr:MULTISPECIES: response regulator [unclassified Acidocella]EKM99498.1 histidine kinase [Acidocella sp. MX-AZ02]WBO58140.1 response regulator [Acidocella sp. MX-AZ03]